MKSPVFPSMHWESLESRELRAGDSPVPDGENDYHLSLASDGSVVESASKEQNARTKLDHFAWFDGTNETMLVPQSNGAITISACHGWYSWPSLNDPSLTRHSEPDETAVRLRTRQVADAGISLIVIDNETWQFDLRYAGRDEIDHTIDRMKKIVGWMHDESPQMKVGIYGYMSQSDDNVSVLWNQATTKTAEGNEWWKASLVNVADRFADWQNTSEYLRPLSECVDYMFPALYTGTSSIDTWEESARITIEDSRRYGKPVIPFLYPYYHPGIGGPLANTELPGEFWERELSFVEAHAEGAMIWSWSIAAPDKHWVQSTLAHAAATQAAENGGQTVEAASLPAALFESFNKRSLVEHFGQELLSTITG